MNIYKDSRKIYIFFHVRITKFYFLSLLHLNNDSNWNHTNNVWIKSGTKCMDLCSDLYVQIYVIKVRNKAYWGMYCEESWEPKNWCFWTVVLEKTLESPLDCEEIQPVHSKGDQSWVFFGRNDAKVETPVLWPPHVKSWLTGKDSDARRDWGQEEKGTTEDEMAG